MTRTAGRVAFVDPVGGVAGDMLLAALLDAGAGADAVREAVERVAPRVRWSIEPVLRGGLAAACLRIDAGRRHAAPVRSLVERVAGAGLDVSVERDAVAILERLGAAERAVHGAATQLHELGDDDTLLDVVGVVAALRSLGVDRVLVGPLPLSFGATIPAHDGASMPLPAPATLELLRGFAVRASGGTAEHVTPTGAAILTALGEPAADEVAMTVDSIGVGAGTADSPDTPNVVRVVVGTRIAAEPASDPVAEPARAAGGGAHDGRELALLETNVDDMTGELLADALDAARAAGALDVWATATLMKKGRPGILVSALCDRGDRDRVLDSLFGATTTFGVRETRVRRFELGRRIEAIDVDGEPVRVKVGIWRGRVVSAKPEHDDVVALAERTGRSPREVAGDAAARARDLLLERGRM